MSIKKSRPYLIDGSNYSFEFNDDGKMIGIKKQDESGNFQPVDPASNEFAGLELSDQALNAYNVNKFGGNTSSYEDSIDISVGLLKKQLYDNEKKKSNNAQFIANDEANPPSLSFAEPRSSYDAYKSRKGRSSDVMSYPLDIDTDQDHMKITRYEYRRPTVNQSKPAERRRGLFGDYTIAGDTVKGSKIAGSIILPMPKPTDVNAVAWGKDEKTISGLAALGTAQKAQQALDFANPIGKLLFGGVTGKSAQDSNEDFLASLRQGGGKRPGQFGTNLLGFGQANMTQFMTKMASGAFGTELSPDTFLARSGGRVLNPNAEMLFQGPAIRAFSFEFQMVARSEREGKEIRKIIRFLKMGMAPKFRNTTFIANPDVFQLEYRSTSPDADTDENNLLKTVNQFSPGGLALTNIAVDYAPSGYWSAYRDSQPVVLKMALDFTELRPLFQGDQDITPEDSVGL